MINNLEGECKDHEKIVNDFTTLNPEADGVIFLEKSSAGDFKMNYYNKDGTGNSLCGNGLRCTMRFIVDNNISNENVLRIEAVSNIYICTNIEEGLISVSFPPPVKVKTNFKLKVHFQEWWELLNCSYVECGSPHIVVFIDEIEKPLVKTLEEVDIKNWGRNIRMHKDLMPEGANVNFVYIISAERGELEIRSYERGVEGETLACGTGAISSSIIYYMCRSQVNPIRILTRSGEYLLVELDIDGKKLLGLKLIGNAGRYK